MAASCRPTSSTKLSVWDGVEGPRSRGPFCCGIPARINTRPENKTKHMRRNAMDPINRRTILTTGAVALAGSALAGEAAQAQAGPKGIFSVATVTIPIVGETDVFPGRRIYCIGRNYAAHSREMGSDPTREPPFFFQKPTDAIQNVKI